MMESGYRCDECRRTFSGGQGVDAVRDGGLRCPTCGSHHVVTIELLEEWGYVARGSPCFG